jgi:hypothetical protein
MTKSSIFVENKIFRASSSVQKWICNPGGSALRMYILPEVYLRPSRQVQSTEGENLAKQNHAAWVETSAKDDANICKFILLSLP